MTQTRRLIGVDVGEARVGIAVSDPLGLTAQPLLVVARRGRPEELFWKEIGDVLRTFDVSECVIGIPLNMDGTAGDQAKRAKSFAKQLRRRFPGVTTPYWDERLTTAASESALIQAGVRREDRREKVDKIAAALILQNYLDFRKLQNKE
ncbi:MAG: Holliday junction resolvase RuvX [bacterium]